MGVADGVEGDAHSGFSYDVEGAPGDPVCDVDCCGVVGGGSGFVVWRGRVGWSVVVLVGGGDDSVYGVDQGAGLGPEDRVKVFDVAVGEGGHEVFALSLFHPLVYERRVLKSADLSY